MVGAEAGYARQRLQSNHLIQMRVDIVECGLDRGFGGSQRRAREAAQAGDVSFLLGVSRGPKKHGISALRAPGRARRPAVDARTGGRIDEFSVVGAISFEDRPPRGLAGDRSAIAGSLTQNPEIGDEVDLGAPRCSLRCAVRIVRAGA